MYNIKVNLLWLDGIVENTRLYSEDGKLFPDLKEKSFPLTITSIPLKLANLLVTAKNHSLGIPEDLIPTNLVIKDKQDAAKWEVFLDIMANRHEISEFIHCWEDFDKAIHSLLGDSLEEVFQEYTVTSVLESITPLEEAYSQGLSFLAYRLLEKGWNGQEIINLLEEIDPNLDYESHSEVALSLIEDLYNYTGGETEDMAILSAKGYGVYIVDYTLWKRR